MTYDGHSKFMRTSIHGKRFGIDDNDNLCGNAGYRNGTETLTASSTLHPGGTSLLAATVAAAYDLPSPSEELVGTQKRIVGLSTANQHVRLQAGNFLTAGQTTATVCLLTTRGAAVDLEYISTAFIAVTSRSSSTAIVSFSTST